jgi:hypothetical protein
MKVEVVVSLIFMEETELDASSKTFVSFSGFISQKIKFLKHRESVLQTFRSMSNKNPPV